MRIISLETQAADVANRFRRQYPESELIAELEALNGQGTPAQIAAIIGNDSWCCDQYCHTCGELFPVVVQVGQEPEPESRTCNICVGCLKQALVLVETP